METIGAAAALDRPKGCLSELKKFKIKYGWKGFEISNNIEISADSK
jgi:hypothetical protein